MYDTMSLEWAICGAPRLICFVPKITRICFRKAETQASAAGSSVQGKFRLIDVVSVMLKPFRGHLFRVFGPRWAKGDNPALDL